MSRSRARRLLAQLGLSLRHDHSWELPSPLVYPEPVTEELELSTAVQEQAHEPQGLPLLAALQASEFLWRAARRYSDTAMLVTDGVRFWTSDLKLNGMYTEELTLPILQDQPVWRPVIGDERGWRLA